ncbi:MAG: 3,4-dihydroxy-2-butanone-4-phosphate synthase, partial [Cyanobacteria bacterium J06635_15]
MDNLISEQEKSEFSKVFDSISEALDDLRYGRMVVVVDDDDRENKGDVVCAA